MSRSVRKIVQLKSIPELPDVSPRKRVVAYARVSTASIEQQNSIAAQKDYYTNLILSNPTRIFSGLYTDDGISGLSRTNRPGFAQMIQDAENGLFDMIITKSISRFARNTVDTLTCVRKLSLVGCGVYFEKENIYSLDNHGKFILTLLSSLAQEESRNISENVAWGTRKRFADGKYSCPYSRFLGYDKGMVINYEEAVTIRLIFRLYIQGYTSYKIASYLMEHGIKSPSGLSKWEASVVKSILHNEKYKGDALLQKRFTVDYLTKKQVKNKGELPQYYVVDGHEAIVPKETFDYAMYLAEVRKSVGMKYSCTHVLSTKIRCTACGEYYTTSYAQGHLRWRCHNNISHGTTPNISNRKMIEACKCAIKQLFLQELELVQRSVGVDSVHCLIDSFSQKIQTPRYNLLVSDEDIRLLIEQINLYADGTARITFIDNRVISVAF